MRAVVQRVASAGVDVAGEAVARIGPGLLALVAVGREDSAKDAEDLAHKIIHLRIFEDADERMNRDLVETGGSLCVVSQFTLFGDVRKGRRPFFGEAADPEHAAPLIEHLAKTAREAGINTETGRFQARMDVHLVNQGPVTILLDTQKRF
jgi:D-tyrosyl-tRNA(Tyr) deacylase